MNRSDVLISAEELLRLQASGPTPRLLDVRWTLPKPDGRDDFAAGHIPGAIYVDLDTELADHANTEPTAGRHPLPSAEQFQDTVRSWAVTDDTEVVVYDDNSSLGAARAWWLLRWAGLDARVLDGGLAAYRAAGGRLETGASPEFEPSHITISPNSLPVIDADAVAAWDGVLLDARAGERSPRGPGTFPGRRAPRPPATSIRGPSSTRPPCGSGSPRWVRSRGRSASTAGPESPPATTPWPWLWPESRRASTPPAGRAGRPTPNA